MAHKKQYGLILPGSSSTAKPKVNIFANDSDSDEDTMDWVKQSLKSRAQGSIQQKEASKAIKVAMAEDPTVYQYDELYDEMEESRVKSKAEEKKERKSKYVVDLLKAAEKRTRENEARVERQVQKEREAEGDEFKDKDAFVTSAYRAKMEELAKIEEDQKRMDAIEEMNDASKQKNLDGFYRSLYKSTVGAEAEKGVESKPQPLREDIQSSKGSPKSIKPPLKERGRDRSKERDRRDRSRDRRDRSRSRSRDRRDMRDRSRSRSRDNRRDRRDRSRDRKERSERRRDDGRLKEERRSPQPVLPEPTEDEENVPIKEEKEEDVVVSHKVPKKDLFGKRTVGEVWDQAFQRYLNRKESNYLTPAVVTSK